MANFFSFKEPRNAQYYREFSLKCSEPTHFQIADIKINILKMVEACYNPIRNNKFKPFIPVISIYCLKITRGKALSIEIRNLMITVHKRDDSGSGI